MSYYERWMAGLVELIVQSGLTTRAEIESGVPARRANGLRGEGVIPNINRVATPVGLANRLHDADLPTSM